MLAEHTAATVTVTVTVAVDGAGQTRAAVAAVAAAEEIGLTTTGVTGATGTVMVLAAAELADWTTLVTG